MKLKPCPVCGRKIKRCTTYINGSTLWVHEEYVKMDPFPHMAVVDSCLVQTVENSTVELVTQV